MQLSSFIYIASLQPFSTYTLVTNLCRVRCLAVWLSFFVEVGQPRRVFLPLLGTILCFIDTYKDGEIDIFHVPYLFFAVLSCISFKYLNVPKNQCRQYYKKVEGVEVSLCFHVPLCLYCVQLYFYFGSTY